MKRRLVLLLIPLLLIAGLITAPAASARILWNVCYGQVSQGCPPRTVSSTANWAAPSGAQHSAYRLAAQIDCNFVFYDPGYPNGVSWATNTVMPTSRRPCTFNWQGDGNWVVRDRNGTPIYATGTNRGSYGYLMSMNDIGQLWIDRSAGVHLWCNHPGACTYQ